MLINRNKNFMDIRKYRAQVFLCQNFNKPGKFLWSALLLHLTEKNQSPVVPVLNKELPFRNRKFLVPIIQLSDPDDLFFLQMIDRSVFQVDQVGFSILPDGFEVTFEKQGVIDR